VEDITRDANFAPWLASTRSAPFRSVLSAPLITTDGRAVGVVSAHFAHEYRPTAVEVASLEAYCRALADRLELLLAGLDVEDVAARLSRDMLAAAG
jgi:GAF domain-containing protein